MRPTSQSSPISDKRPAGRHGRTRARTVCKMRRSISTRSVVSPFGLVRVVALVSGIAVVLAGCGWTQFRNGPAHTGQQLFETAINANTVSTLVQAWIGVTGGEITSSPAVANGVVYVGSDVGKLYAFDAAGVTGWSGVPSSCSPLWTATTGGAIESSPAVANGVVYVGSDDHTVSAFNAAGQTSCTGTPTKCPSPGARPPAARCNRRRPSPTGGLRGLAGQQVLRLRPTLNLATGTRSVRRTGLTGRLDPQRTFRDA